MVAVVVVAERFRRLRLRARRLGDPLLGNELLSFELAAVEHELADLGDVLRQDIEPPAALLVPHRAGFPEEVRNPQRIKQPWL
ncbi:hypothetical protein SDC9_198123 [bioreactor metagenome]|uniref:Uncharacterized protein n=1 Tax=bioreactor metagenome TaxID=1076179 RepID=A0A645IHM4_9ZZZZ